MSNINILISKILIKITFFWILFNVKINVIMTDSTKIKYKDLN